MEAIIQAHPEGVSIIVANNDDMAAGAARAAAAFPAYKNTIFVGVGGNLAGIDAILAGQETMTVAVDGYDVGYLGVQAAVDALNGKKLDEFIEHHSDEEIDQDEQIMGILKYLTDWLINHILYVDCQIPKPQ